VFRLKNGKDLVMTDEDSGIGNLHYPDEREAVAILLQRKVAGFNFEGRVHVDLKPGRYYLHIFQSRCGTLSDS